MKGSTYCNFARHCRETPYTQRFNFSTWRTSLKYSGIWTTNDLKRFNVPNERPRGDLRKCVSPIWGAFEGFHYPFVDTLDQFFRRQVEIDPLKSQFFRLKIETEIYFDHRTVQLEAIASKSWVLSRLWRLNNRGQIEKSRINVLSRIADTTLFHVIKPKDAKKNPEAVFVYYLTRSWDRIDRNTISILEEVEDNKQGH